MNRRIACAGGWLAVVTGLLGIWTVALVATALGWDPPSWASWMSDRHSFAGAMGYLVVLSLWLALYLRRLRTPDAATLGRSSDLWHAAGSLAAVTLALGFVSSLRCSGGEVPVLTPLYWTLELFVGNQPGPDAAETCASWPPLAMEIARLTGLLAVFVGAAAAVLQALHARWSHSQLRADEAAFCFTGVDSESLPLVVEAARRPERAGRVYVVDPNPEDPAIRAATASGAVFVPDHGWDPALIRLAVSSGRRLRNRRDRGVGVREFSCVSADDETNIRVFLALAEQVEARRPGTIVAAQLGDDGRDPEPASGGKRSRRRSTPSDSRILIRVRIDDMNRAEDWWRRQASQRTFSNARYEVDCVGMFDATARRISAQVEAEAQRLLVNEAGGSTDSSRAETRLPTPVVIIDGESQLALAMLKHLARATSLSLELRREEAAKRTKAEEDGHSAHGFPPGRPSLEFRPHVVVTGPAAAELLADAEARWDLTSFDAQTAEARRVWELDMSQIPPGPVFAVITEGNPNDELHAYRVLRRLWAQRVWLTVPRRVNPAIGEAAGSSGRGGTWSGAGLGGAATSRAPSELDQRARVTRQPLQLTPSGHRSIWDQVAYYVGRLYNGPGGGLSAEWEPTEQEMEHNRHPVFLVARLVADAGLVWGPPHRARRGGICCSRSATDEDTAHDEKCVFDDVCRLEHDRWLRMRRAERWKWGPVRDDAKKETPLLVEWHELAPTDREYTVKTVNNVLTVLRIMGFSPWYRVDRAGTYDKAEQLSTDREVLTPRGSTHGRAGDWEVTRGDSSWIVSADAFARAYDQGSRTRRPGAHGLLARPCTGEEQILNRRFSGDAPAEAKRGDWIVREAGIEWPMPPDDFAAGYQILGRN